MNSNETSAPSRLVSIKEVKALLGCGASKVWSLVRGGHLTRVRFGARMTRFRYDEVLDLMEKGI